MILLAVTLWTATTCLPAPLGAQELSVQDLREAHQHGIFLDTIDVNLINIEVMAYDRDGNPVHGLTRADFELLVDEKPVEITNFLAVERGERVASAEIFEPPAPGAPGVGKTPTTPDLPTQRYVVLFVDQGNITPNHRRRVFESLRQHLDRLMEPADRVAVVAQDSEVTIVQSFTGDRELVESALETLEGEANRGVMRSLEPHRIEQEIEGGQNPPGAGDLLITGGTTAPPEPQRGQRQINFQPSFAADARRTFSQVTAHAQATQTHGLRTIRALEQFVDSLAGLPGRKAVLYVSDGLELAPAERLFRMWDFKYATVAREEVGIANIENEIDRYRLLEPFRGLVASASASRVAFYTIEGGSDRGSGDISAEGRSLVTDPLVKTADSDREESLRALAHDTGGIPLINNASVEPILARLESDFRNYYSLGYPSPHEGDGAHHRVEVRVKDRPDLRLRYLESYRDKGSDDRMTDQTLANLLHDVGENPLEVQVEIGKHARTDGGKGFVVPVMVKVPMSHLMLIPQQDAHLGRLSIFIAVRDDSGRLSEPQKIDVPVRVPNEKLLEALGQTAGYLTRIRMRRGDQKLAIGVRDEVAAVGSTLNLALAVGGG